MSRFGVGVVIVAVALAVPTSVPASEESSTTVTLQDLSDSGAAISVSGTAIYGNDATSDLVLGVDPAGDAQVSGVGLDLAAISVRPDLEASALIWNLKTHDGIVDPIGANPPATGYMVPIMADGDDRWRWLAAGNSGSGFPPQPGKWTGLCDNEEEQTGQTGGYECPTGLPGSVSVGGVTWTQPFTNMKPQIRHGSVIESSSMNISGSVWCANPCSFPWLAVARPHNAFDVIDGMDPYKVPGQVMLAIAPSGHIPSEDSFTTKAMWRSSDSRFTGSLTKPQEPGSYTVWARTCFGLAETPTCVRASADVTI